LHLVDDRAHQPTTVRSTNPIERIWWHLHETLTRNHRCQSIEAFLSEVYCWTDQQNFYFQTASFRDLYRLAAKRYAAVKDLFRRSFKTVVSQS